MQQLFKVQLNKQDGQGWRDMSYSPRTEQEAQGILNHYQSAFPKFIYRLREFQYYVRLRAHKLHGRCYYCYEYPAPRCLCQCKQPSPDIP